MVLHNNWSWRRDVGCDLLNVSPSNTFPIVFFLSTSISHQQQKGQCNAFFHPINFHIPLYIYSLAGLFICWASWPVTKIFYIFFSGLASTARAQCWECHASNQLWWRRTDSPPANAQPALLSWQTADLERTLILIITHTMFETGRFTSKGSPC